MPEAKQRQASRGDDEYSRFVEILDSRTLLPIDHPQALAHTITTFITDH